jgi:hypothetical protein
LGVSPILFSLFLTSFGTPIIIVCKMYHKKKKLHKAASFLFKVYSLEEKSGINSF